MMHGDVTYCDAAIGEYHGIQSYWGVEDAGVVTAKIDEQKTGATRISPPTSPTPAPSASGSPKRRLRVPPSARVPDATPLPPTGWQRD